jgi:hypothetical protein
MPEERKSIRTVFELGQNINKIISKSITNELLKAKEVKNVSA